MIGEHLEGKLVSQTAVVMGEIASARAVQAVWSHVAVEQRCRVMRRMRLELARRAEDFPRAMPAALQRSAADTLVAEVLPLLEACRFLERNAAALLAPRALEDDGRFVWLGDVTAEIHRDPAGIVLIIAPANYPLFPAGVQCLQALMAGNAVLWKPAPGTGAVAQLFADCWSRVAGSASGTLRILDEADATATEAIHAGVDRVFLTGSTATGEAVMRELAKTGTSAVMELSGCDSVFVLEGADIARVVEALAFGMRFNGSATCMAPGRVFVTEAVANDLVGHLLTALDSVEPPTLPLPTQQLLAELIADAQANGGIHLLDDTRCMPPLTPTFIDHARPEMRVMQTDIFAPVLAVMRVASVEDALEADARCPYALTAAIFGPELEARAVALRINAGTVFINDVITPAADPRAPFGGRKRSGFGVTRGAEGLLAMTNIKTVMTQRSRSRRRYQPTTRGHAEFFAAYVAVRHAPGLWRMLAAIPRLLLAGLTLKRKTR